MMPPKLDVSVPMTMAVMEGAPTDKALAAPVTLKMARPSASAHSRSRRGSARGRGPGTREAQT